LIHQIIDIRPSFCVMWLWSWHKRHLWRVDRQSRYGANFWWPWWADLSKLTIVMNLYFFLC